MSCDFGDAAEAAGRRLARDAIWHGGRCSWMGAVEPDARRWRPRQRALGPTLYGGTAGVGLFLAELATATGEPSFRRAALGALRQAAARAPALGPDARDGFHGGSIGIAWALARACDLLDAEELRAAARAVLAGAAPDPQLAVRPGIVHGRAGWIVGALALANALDAPALVEDARAAGAGLLAAAAVTRHGWSWATPGHARLHRLCGLAHGAAGVGWALSRLAAATAEPRFVTAAAGAFAYERSWLDPATGTWPDLRHGRPRRGAPRVAPSPALATWCHGEAGIALARLDALRVLDNPDAGDDARTALETTHRHVAAALPFALEDLSLCHGLAGAAEALQCGAAALGGHWRAAADCAADLGRAALERGTAAPAAATPGLFRGTAGTGWWLLRLHDPATASPLMVPMQVDSGVRTPVRSAQ